MATDRITRPTACIMDEMAVIQKHKGNQTTFAANANTILRKLKDEASDCSRADAGFDDYEDESI